MRLAALAGLVACGGDPQPTWIRFEPVDLPEWTEREPPTPGRFCGDRVLTRDGITLIDVNTGAATPLPDVPNDPNTGRIGRVTCHGTTFFTAPPDTNQAFRSRDQGPWEELRTGRTDTVVLDIMATAHGDIYRVIAAVDDSVLPLIERSTDDGDSWSPLPTSMVVPAGGEATEVTLISAEGFLAFEVRGDSGSGVIRTDLDGLEPVVSEDFVEEYQSPVPEWQRGADLLVTRATTPGNTHAKYALDNYWIGQSPAKTTPVFDYRPALLAGLFDPSGAQAGSVTQVAIDRQERVWITFADRWWRSTAPWFEDVRADVLLSDSCEHLEEPVGEGPMEGPGEVRFIHTGDEPRLVGLVEEAGIQWRNATVLVDDRFAYAPLANGDTLAVQSETAPVLIADTQGRCLAVLSESPDEEVDLGAY